ncbi:hypothetical protein KZZ52_27080 [Dactylosporangium sp. AC04546]|uniref:hypothetical protein n=1 Tax=Dactylosporangium sp. AC04546 TaxID=2862460 RepID=UPI001EDDFFAD|nr:hypothetical protein [Dactylosporangium sp. AC04546]WVK88930.1 hypothetical protein KZZ52_27080 [Dactylosporangium sp. AC04546]
MNTSPSDKPADTAADALRDALQRVDDRVDGLTPADVTDRLTALLASAGARPEPAIDDLDLDLVLLSWEVEFAAGGTTASVRGNGPDERPGRIPLHDEIFEQLHGRAREEFDPAPKLDVALDAVTGAVTVRVIAAGRVADDVDSIAVVVPTSGAGVVRVPLVVDRTDVTLAGTVDPGTPVGAIQSPLRVEVVRRAR